MTDKKEILAVADREIQQFEAWFTAQGNEPLAKFERAILKSYLVAKSAGKLEPITESTELGPCQLN
jgi:site-specific recombinase XerD